MKKRFEYLIPSKNENNKFILKDADTGLVRTDIYVRDIMLEKAVDNGQCIKFDNETGRSYRKPMSVLDENKAGMAPTEEQSVAHNSCLLYTSPSPRD